MAKKTIQIPQGATEVVVDTVDQVTAVVAVPASVVTFNTVDIPNVPPIANAGTDITITLPVSSVTLNGVVNDSDGVVVSQQWTKVSGGVATITNPANAITTVTGLVEGNYVFRLSTTDDKGATDTDDVSITVKAAVIVVPPTGYTLTFENDFAQSSDINDNQLGLGGYSTKDGGCFKSLVNGVNTSSGWRSEQQYTQAAANPTEGAVEYDVNYESVFASGGHSFQWHPNADGASACLAMWHNEGKFYIVQKLAGDKGVYQTGTLTPIATNKWYKMRVEYKFSTGTDGYFRWYIDGVLYHKKENAPTAFSNSGQYVKIGQN